jgi:osmoprotectant transport system ATP-binding protein
MSPVYFENVSHFYGTKTILNEIDFNINHNMITVIIGKSGSGKSTLLQMINGLVLPSKGQVHLFEKRIDYNRIHELRLSIGYSVQGTGLFPHMTVFENITLLARINNWQESKIQKRLERLMRFVDLDMEYLDKYPYQLSGGEQQRVGICRAMMLKPKIFLLDEPFAALDVITRNEIHKELQNLQKAEPRTIVMVTHDVNEALKLADKILVLHNGVIQQYGNKNDILERPANTFVKTYIHNQLENN